ncbi:MAG: sigma-70 family RNA polymerase sigma factor [Kineosporiaceae bacterium]|nr:sigma-70 family RNA polymerase sigma factor [Aeromicrobium sp.]
MLNEFGDCPAFAATSLKELTAVTTHFESTENLEELLLRVAAGDRIAFAELYDLTQVQVRNVIVRCLIDWAQSEEVAQEVYLEIWQNAAKVEMTIAGASTWILMIAHRRAIDRVRASQASRTRDLAVGIRDLVPTHHTVEHQVETTIEFQRAMSACDRITERQRLVVHMVYLQGLSQTEIAAALQVSVSSVKGRLRSGLTQLRKQMTAPHSQRGPDPESAYRRLPTS